jgi:hypothetical protein
MLRKLLSMRKAAILRRWRADIFAGYPPETSMFLQRESDRFSNPVGHAVNHGTEAIFQGILDESSAGDLSHAMDEIIRIRAVQDFTPSQAVVFIFHLKKAVREELGDEIQIHGIEGELVELESRIDKIALLGFDIYTACRKKIDEIRAEQKQGQGLHRSGRRKSEPRNGRNESE